MRPIKLELEGFTAYREFTAVDFAGADLFVLTGPTGSGKSSIIDAITFALYGSVSRYANPNLVHPVISQGKVEAKVRFDFAVEDSSTRPFAWSGKHLEAALPRKKRGSSPKAASSLVAQTR